MEVAEKENVQAEVDKEEDKRESIAPPSYSRLRDTTIEQRCRQILAALDTSALFAEIPAREARYRLPSGCRRHAKTINKCCFGFIAIFSVAILVQFSFGIVGRSVKEEWRCRTDVPMSVLDVIIGSLFLVRVAITLCCRCCLARRVVTSVLDILMALGFVVLTVFVIINSINYFTPKYGSYERWVADTTNSTTMPSYQTNRRYWEPAGGHFEHIEEYKIEDKDWRCYVILGLSMMNAVLFWIAFIPIVIIFTSHLKIIWTVTRPLLWKLESEMHLIDDESDSTVA